MRMTNRKALKALIDNMNLDEGITRKHLNTLLLVSIANSLAIIADALTDRKVVEDGNNQRL